MSLTDKAKEYLGYNLSVIPTKEDKVPALPSWTPYQSQRIKENEAEALFSGANIKGLGIICGAVSGNLEVIDVDTKHDTTGSLWDELRTFIQDNLPELYSSLVIAQTKSGGYHIYYRCKEIKGNLKLATKQNREVLIETRGEGGYVIAPPTNGYTYIQGEPGNIPTITPEEREILFSISKSFNQLQEEKPKVNTPASANFKLSGNSPFEDYNQRGDIVGLLESKGWKAVNQRGERINLLRPGSTDSKTSGNYHTGLKVLRVFSSSTEFNPGKGYSPAQVFSLLECNEDNKLTYRRLLELGYGEPYTNGGRIAPTQVKTELITVNSVNSVNRESLVISSPGESLKIENIQTAIGEEIVISSPGPEATDEVLKAIELIQETGKRIYVKEGPEEVRSYEYELQAIVNKYVAIQETNGGGLTDRNIDSLLDEVVKTSQRIVEATDRDRYKKSFINRDWVSEGLGLTEESLSITIDRLTSTKDKENQSNELKKLLSEVTALQDKGETDKALELLDKQSKQIKAITGAGLLPPPLSFTTLLDEIATTPPAFQTGYPCLDKFVGFTPGAISLIAGRPSHGKTTLMFNLLLEMSSLYGKQGYSFKYFHYEEPNRNIGIKILNRLSATDLSSYYGGMKLAKHTNYEFIKAYIKAGRSDIPQLEEGKRLLKELIDSQTIQLIETRPTVENLSKLMAHYCKDQKIGGVFIDYIQRMTTEKKTENIRVETNIISKTLLDIAVSNNIPLIVGAQLNRESAKTGTKKPTLEGLKESGNLEEDANTVLSVYNESREREENAEGESYNGLQKVELEIKALKNREGEVNKKAKLTFDKWTGVIKDQDNSSPKYEF